jgi:solute carrier family 35 protein C2
MSVLTPIMAAISLVLSFALEPWRKFGESHFFDSPEHILYSIAIMLLGGCLAFFMVRVSSMHNLSYSPAIMLLSIFRGDDVVSSCTDALNLNQVSTEYILLQETSAVTLTVAGIVKELVTVLVRNLNFC